MQDDKDLVEKILRGKTTAFRQLVERYQRLVMHIVFRLIPNPQDREEICQEIFIKVYQHLASFKFNSKMSTWIGKITFNTCLNFLRREKNILYADILTVSEGEDSKITSLEFVEIGETEMEKPDQYAERREWQKKIQDYIAGLPAPYRLIITLFHLDELSYQEIAEITGLPEGTIKSHLFRGRKLIKEKLIRDYQGEVLWT